MFVSLWQREKNDSEGFCLQYGFPALFSWEPLPNPLEDTLTKLLSSAALQCCDREEE